MSDTQHLGHWFEYYVVDPRTRRGTMISTDNARRWLQAELVEEVERDESQADVTVIYLDAKAPDLTGEGA